MSREPVAIAAAVRAVLYAVAAFGFDISPAQIGAVMVAVEACLAVVIRNRVSPV